MASRLTSYLSPFCFRLSVTFFIDVDQCTNFSWNVSTIKHLLEKLKFIKAWIKWTNTHIKKKFLINFPCIFYEPGKCCKIFKPFSLTLPISLAIDFHLFSLWWANKIQESWFMFFLILKIKTLQTKQLTKFGLKVKSFFNQQNVGFKKSQFFLLVLIKFDSF